MTLLAPSAAHLPQRRIAKSPTTPYYKSRRNAVYFSTLPLLPTLNSIEQLTRSPSEDDEIAQEQKDIKSFFFVVNIEEDQSVEFCHLSFDFLYGNDEECGMYSDFEWGEANHLDQTFVDT
jgi:hypothetical protein